MWIEGFNSTKQLFWRPMRQISPWLWEKLHLEDSQYPCYIYNVFHNYNVLPIFFFIHLAGIEGVITLCGFRSIGSFMLGHFSQYCKNQVVLVNHSPLAYIWIWISVYRCMHCILGKFKKSYRSGNKSVWLV